MNPESRTALRGKCEHRKTTIYMTSLEAEPSRSCVIEHHVCDRCGFLFGKDNWTASLAEKENRGI